MPQAGEQAEVERPQCDPRLHNLPPKPDIMPPMREQRAGRAHGLQEATGAQAGAQAVAQGAAQGAAHGAGATSTCFSTQRETMRVSYTVSQCGTETQTVRWVVHGTHRVVLTV